MQIARKEGARRKRDREFETAEEVIEKLMDLVEDQPDIAGRQAQFILKHAKDSPYNPTTNTDPLAEERENAKELVKDVKGQIDDD